MSKFKSNERDIPEVSPGRDVEASNDSDPLHVDILPLGAISKNGIDEGIKTSFLIFLGAIRTRSKRCQS